MSTKENPLNTDNTVPTIRCNYCKRIAYWVKPATGIQMCSNCKQLTDHEEWHDLALRWLTNYPEDWAPDVAAFLEVASERKAAPMERLVPTGVCKGCNGTLCGSEPHRYPRVMPLLGPIAKISRGKGGAGSS